MLVRHQTVDVALDQERPARPRHHLPGEVKAVERLALLVEGGLRGVEVLGLLPGEGPAAEGDDTALAVGDREDEAPAEAIIVAGGVLPRQDEACAEERLDRMAVLARGVEEPIPALGRKAEPEGPRGLAPDSPPVEVGPGPRGVRPVPEPGFEPTRGPLHEREEPVAGPGLAHPLVTRQGNTRPLGQEPHGLGELETVVTAEELEGVATGVAAEAVKEVQLRVDREGGRLFLVKRAEALPALAGALERNDRPHEVHEIDACADLVEDLGGHSHGWPSGLGRAPPRRRASPAPAPVHRAPPR